jgi:hypothetical protein
MNIHEHQIYQTRDLNNVEKIQIDVAKQKVKKIISTHKQDSIRHRKVPPEQLGMYVLRMRGTGFELNSCFHHQACTHSISDNHTGETSRMSCSRKRLQEAAEAGCVEGPAS